MRLVEKLALEKSHDLWIQTSVSINFRLLLEFLFSKAVQIDDHLVEVVEAERTSKEKCIKFLQIIKEFTGLQTNFTKNRTHFSPESFKKKCNSKQKSRNNKRRYFSLDSRKEIISFVSDLFFPTFKVLDNNFVRLCVQISSTL